MTPEGKKNICKEKPLLLVSCLDWGLGHTTRCIPLIRELIHLDCRIIIACNSIQKNILQPEFPDVRFEMLRGYDLQYSRGKWSTRLKIAVQLGKILTRINDERRWLDDFLTKNNVSGLIADNRYGLFSARVPCVFITHQLAVKTGFGRVFDKISQQILYKYINRFSECWVPDVEQKLNFAGELSQPCKKIAIPLRYLGAISRFETCGISSNFLHDVVILLSGPEPQRTILENIMLKQLPASDLKVVLVRGLPGNTSELKYEGITVYNHPDAAQLNKIVCESKFVICRSGYSTIMDMMKLQKKMVVIPTPGQAEQEYLAKHLSTNKLAVSTEQHRFQLQPAIDAAEKFPYRFISDDMNAYKPVLKNFVARISS